MENAKKKPEFILLNIGHAEHNANWNFKNVHSPFTRIHFVEKGTAQIIRADGVNMLLPDHMYLTPAYTKHSYACNDFLSLYYIHIYEKPDELSIFEQFIFPVEVKSTPLDLLLIKKLTILTFHGTDHSQARSNRQTDL
jgi:mannose-6-phosphate isomerase-like protein (cupin superfamily)